jgi:hypothetical protein
MFLGSVNSTILRTTLPESFSEYSSRIASDETTPDFDEAPTDLSQG